MRPFLERAALILIVLGIPTLAAVPAYAQDAVRPQTRPTFLVPTTVNSGPAPTVRLMPTVREAWRAAQAPAARDLRTGWEVEFHAGGAWSHAGTGMTTMPEPGPGLFTFSGQQTRLVRSWYFGDGTAMINAHLGSAGIAPRITALDPVLNASSVGSSGFGAFGARVGRSLTPTFGVEFAFDMTGALAFTDTARSGAEATRSTFQSAFNARFGTFQNTSVTSTLTMTDGSTQMLTTGAVTINLRTSGRIVPYIAAGGGLLFSTGDDPLIALAGDYSFVSSSGTRYHQTDTLNVRYALHSTPVVLAGGGLKWHLTSRSGVRADFRVQFSGNPMTVVVNWNPATTSVSPTNAIVFTSLPALQISTNNPAASTLSLKQVHPDYEVSSGGMRQTMNFAIGYFYRFPTGSPAPRQPAPAPASGVFRDGTRPWEMDVHGGGQWGAEGSGGTPLDAFPAGSGFTASSGFPSRFASTWMFGDGAVLVNQIAAGFTSVPVAGRMSSLDPVLTESSLARSSRGSVGARLSRRITSRLRAEFEVESAGTSVGFSPASMSRIEATRTGFLDVWNGLIATGGGILMFPTVSASANVSARTNWETSFTAGLEFRVWQSRRLEAYASGGAGILHRAGALPEATLTGSYAALFAGFAPITETDLVRVHFAIDQTAPVVTFGGGLRYFMTPRSGLRADVRFHASDNSVDTFVDANPSNVPGGPPGFPVFVFSSATNPALAFSTVPAVRGNLTGPPITSLQTFTGSGQQTKYSITAGYFFRF